MKFVPFALNMILHYYTTPEPWTNTSGVTDEWHSYFIRERLLDQCPKKHPIDDDSYVITDKGRAFVDMLCNTPLPVTGWRDPRTGQEIERF